MSTTLHEAVVPQFLRMLDTVEHLIGKAEAHCAEHSVNEGDICGGKLAPDMLDFTFQVKSANVHSAGAIEGIRSGVFSPDRSEPASDFATMRTRLEEARAALRAITPEEIDELGDKDMEFRIGDKLVVPFKGKDFLYSFSMPNLYFHVTTAYAILRSMGVPIGKKDFLGPNWAKR